MADRQYLIFAKRLVRIAVQPALARLRRSDDRMPACVRMFGGVPIRRAIAAERYAACLTRAQMYPGRTDLHAFFAFATMRLLDGFNRNRIQMRTASGAHDRLA